MSLLIKRNLLKLSVYGNVIRKHDNWSGSYKREDWVSRSVDRESLHSVCVMPQVRSMVPHKNWEWKSTSVTPVIGGGWHEDQKFKVVLVAS